MGMCKLYSRFAPYNLTPVEKIKERLSIVDVISSYLKLEKAGKHHKALCPFHSEKNPSFFVSPERQSFYCFSCNRGGDIFTFVEEFEGLDFKGALALLAKRAGVSLSRKESTFHKRQDRLIEIMERALSFYEHELKKHPKVIAYLKGRGFSRKIIDDFRLGYAPEGWRNLYLFLKKRGVSEKDMEKVGLINPVRGRTRTQASAISNGVKKKEEGRGWYDRFRERIIFPITNSAGEVIAFSGRYFPEKEDDVPKYVNSPDTVLFSKSDILYGLDKAKHAIRKHDFSILVEGQMDLILSHQSGLKNTVALSGTALTDSLVGEKGTSNHLGQIRNLSRNLLIAFDGDEAGRKAALRSAEIALSLGMEVKIAALPEGKDPADIIKEDKEKYKKILTESKHIIEFVLESVLKEKEVFRASGEIREKVLPLVKATEGSMEKASFVKMIHERTGLKEEAIWDDLKKVEGIKKEEVKTIEHRRGSPVIVDSRKRKLLGILLWQEGNKKPPFSVEGYKQKMMEIIGEEDYEKLIQSALSQKEELIFEAEVQCAGGDIKKDVEELLANLEEEELQKAFIRSMNDLHSAEKEGNNEDISRLLKKCQELSNRINEIKSARFR